MKLTYNHTMKCCFAAYMSSATVNNILPLLFLTMQRLFGITLAQLGFLIVLNFGVQMVVDFLGAKYADRWGYRATIITALTMAALGLCALSLLPFVFEPFTGLICSVCMYAIGSGLLEVIISPIVEALPSDNKEAAMSLLHSFYCWGQLTCTIVSTAFFVAFGIDNWRLLLCMWALLPFVTMLFFTKAPMCSLQSDSNDKTSLLSLFRQKGFAIFFVIMLCSGASELAMAQWVSYFAEEGLGVSKTVGDLLGPGMFALCMGLGRVFFSKKSEKVNLSKYLILCAAVVTLSYVGAAVVKVPIVSLIFCALCGVGVAVMWPGTLSLAAKTMPCKSTAMFAMLAVGGDIGCAIGPEAIALGASAFSLHGSGIKAGLLCSVIFPVVLALCVHKVSKTKN